MVTNKDMDMVKGTHLPTAGMNTTGVGSVEISVEVLKEAVDPQNYPAIPSGSYSQRTIHTQTQCMLYMPIVAHNNQEMGMA